jgi:hypothetical protein
MADLKTQFGFTDSLFDAINEVKKASGTSVAGADAQIRRAKANLDAAELRARHEKERDKVQKKKESLRTEEAEQVDEADKKPSTAQMSHQGKTTLKHIKNPTVQQRMAAHDIKPGTSGYRDRIDALKDAKAHGNLKEEEIEESFSASQIATLKKEYSTINGIDPSSDNYKKLIAMLDKLDLASLKSLAGAEIKFVSGLAKNRVMRKSVKEEVESLDELSKDTLKSYAKKAVGDLHKQGVKQNDQKAVARYKGLHKAVDKLSEEDVEEELKGGQVKLDKNKNGKLDAEDFKKVRKEDVEIEEGTGNLKPGWMLKKDPELAKKVKEKQDLAKKRQASYGDKSAGKSVAEGIMDKIKAVKRGMDARAKAADHFDKAGDPTNPNKSKDLKRAVKYHNLVNKEEVESDEVGIVEALETSKVPVGSRPKGIGWSLHRAGKQHNEPHDTYKRTTKQVASSSSKNEETINETGGPKVYQKDNKHIEKYSDDKFWLYVDNKKTKEFSSLEMAKSAALEEEVKDEYGRKVDKYLKKKYGSDDSKKKQPQGAEAAEKRRKERLASNGRMDEEVKVGDKVSFDHPMKAIPGKTMKKVGTVHKVEDGTVHIKVKDKYGVINHKKSASELTKEEFESIDEAPKYDNKYTIYHKDYSSAVQHAALNAGKQGYEIDHDDWDRVVAMGPKKPSSGKTNILTVSLKKDGKESKKKLHMQVYNMDNKGYELNTYVEEVQLDELSKKTLGSYVKKAAFDLGQKGISAGQHTDKKKWLPITKKMNKRTDSIVKATDKLTKEDVEHINELNKDTVYSYAKKSEKDQDNQEKKMGAAIKAKDPKTANDAGRKFLNRLRGSERAEKRLNAEEADSYDEYKSGGKPLEKKFNKAFKAMGIKSDIKIKTVGNVSVNEAVKPTKKFKDMKKKNTAGTKSEEGSSKKGEPLSGKKESIEVNPELHKNQK